VNKSLKFGGISLSGPYHSIKPELDISFSKIDKIKQNDNNYYEFERPLVLDAKSDKEKMKP